MCCRVSKSVLVIVNIVFLLIGAVNVGFSTWVILSSDNHLLKLASLAQQGSSNIEDETQINYKTSTSTLVKAAWVTLAMGALAFVIGLCGFLGAIKEDSYLLFINASTLRLVKIASIVGGNLVGAVLTAHSTDLPKLDHLEETYFLPINLVARNQSAPNAVFSSLVNYAQVSLECCGVFNMTDITGENTLWTNSSRLYKNGTLVVPVTCCRTKNRDELLSHQNWSRIDDYLMDPNCPYNSNSTEINTEICYSKIANYIFMVTLALLVVRMLLLVVGAVEAIVASAYKKSGRNGREDSITEPHQAKYQTI